LKRKKSLTATAAIKQQHLFVSSSTSWFMVVFRVSLQNHNYREKNYREKISRISYREEFLCEL